jgi:hypothetical protein
MSPEQSLRPRFSSSQDQPTTAYRNAQPRQAHKGRCKMALVAGSGVHFTEEIGCLLRHRLRIAALIALLGCLVFFIRNLLWPEARSEDQVVLFFHSAVMGVLVLVAAFLWSRVVLSVRVLRLCELTMFGVMALFFGYLQYWTFHNGRLLDWAQLEHRNRFLSMVTAGNSLRWFVLIILYGTFIPNTWKRCALIVGILTLTPLVLNFAICYQCPKMGAYNSQTLFEMAVVLAMGSAIAIFGSYKIGELHQEAFAARQLGQYQLQRRLGAGGMGEVHLAEHMLLRRACAIKIIRPDQAGDPTTLARFEREVQAMATLSHWNTVEIYDYGHAEDGTFYYVMEYLPGLTLQDMVDRYGPLPPGRAIYFLRQICAALDEAHAIGLIHRDIKPRNVIACQRGHAYDVAKLLDFGLVQTIGMSADGSKLTIQGTILGSPPYMSPEQALGKNHVDARTDIYSVGALAYFLLTGQPPFPRETSMEMLMAHVHDSPPPLTDLRPEIPHDLQEVVRRCLQKEPEQRFANVDSLERALAECASADHWDRDKAAEWWKRLREASSDETIMQEAVA